jgi:hypothetical protein
MKISSLLSGASIWLSLTLAVTAQPAGVRTWTSVDDHKTVASMVGFDGTTVSLQLADGKVVPVSLSRLSAADQAWVKGQPVKAAPRAWPELVKVTPSSIEVKLVREESAAKKFVYRSEGFEYTSQGKLLPRLISEVATTFEATKKLMNELPWGIVCRPPDGMELYQAALYETRDEYIRAGGPSNSGGVYMSGEKIFKIPFESLGIKSLGKSYTKDENYSSDTLVHEITHQMMHDVLPYLPMWAIEGSAEYAELLPYKSGTFGVKRSREGLKDYLDTWQKRQRTPTLPKLADLFRLKRTEWTNESLEPSRQHALYQQSALLVYYFNHVDGDGSGSRWIRFMEATRSEAESWRIYDKGFKSYRASMDEFFKLPGVTKLEDGRFSYPPNLNPPKPPPVPGGQSYGEDTPLKHLDVLLDGRSEEQLQRDIATGYARIGIKLGL